MSYLIKEVEEYINTLKIDKSLHTVRVYKTAIDKLFTFSKIKVFEDILNLTSQDLRLFQQFMKDEGSQYSTINTRLRPIKAMFNWMVENDYLEKSPASKIKELKIAKKEKAFLTEDEIKVLMCNIKGIEDRFIIALLLTTGLRRNELVSLKLKDVIDSHITVHGKGNKERTLILQPEIVSLLDEYLDYRNHRIGFNLEWLFVSRKRGQFSGEGILAKVKRVMKEAGFSEDRVKEIHTHSLRHTFVANLFESGADIYVAQRALGHENLETTMKYAHLRNSALDTAMLNQKSIFS